MDTTTEDDGGRDDIYSWDLDTRPPDPPAATEVQRFLHHNLEASSLLRLPDLPSIHLAVTAVRAMLMALVEGAPLDERRFRISALHDASWAVLEDWPFECAAATFLSSLGLPFDQEASDLAYATKRTDWLGLAREQIRVSGLDRG